MESLTPAQMVIKIVNEEMTALMGGGEARLNSPSSPPAVVLLLRPAGLRQNDARGQACADAEKCRATGRCSWLRCLPACRHPAAAESVGQRRAFPSLRWGPRIPVKISKAAVAHAKDYGNDFVLIDTAGRLQIDETLMDELKNIKEAVHPTDILLVVDAMTGQEAVNVVKVV